MNGKIINPVPTNLSYGGVFTVEAASPVTTLSSKLGNATLSTASVTASLAHGDSFPGASTNIPISKSGKTPIGIIGHSVDTKSFGFQRCFINGSNCRVTLYCNEQSISGSKVNVKVWIYVYYIQILIVYHIMFMMSSTFLGAFYF